MRGKLRLAIIAKFIPFPFVGSPPERKEMRKRLVFTPSAKSTPQTKSSTEVLNSSEAGEIRLFECITLFSIGFVLMINMLQYLLGKLNTSFPKFS